MAVSGYGDSYKPKKVKKNRTYKEKLDARTTETSRERFKAKHNRGQRGGGGGNRPAPVDPLQQRADALTNLRYGGAETELNQRGASIAPWFQNYQNDLLKQRAQSQQYAAPIIQQAQASAQQAGQVAPGVDPNSQAGQDAALAAAARMALGNNLASMYQGFGQLQDNFMAGRGAVGAAAEVGEQGRLARDRSALASDKGLYNATTVEDLRDKQHTQNLESAAYGLDVTQEQNDQANAAADRKAANNEVNQYGYSKKAWNALTPEKRRKIMADVKAEQRPPKSPTSAGGLTPAQQRAAKAKRGKAINRVNEIGTLYDDYSKGKVKVTGPDGKETTRPPTASEIRARLRKEGYSESELSVAMRVKAGKPLNATQRATARRLGIYPIPKAWKQPGASPGYGGGHGGASDPASGGEYRPT